MMLQISGDSSERYDRAKRVPGGTSNRFCMSFGGQNWEGMMSNRDYPTVLGKNLGVDIEVLFEDFDPAQFQIIWDEMVGRESTPMLCICILILGKRFNAFLLTRPEAEQKRVEFLIGLCQADYSLKNFLI